MEKRENVVIVGAGPAGLTAAVYLIRAGYGALVLEEGMYGGQVASTPTIENYPGIIQITGVDFSVGLYQQASELGAEVLFQKLTGCSLAGEVKTLTTSEGTLQTRALIIANGARRAKLGCGGEERLAGRGVSYCATCDGALYRGKETAVVGGGNTALEDALFLANTCSTVHLIHRRDAFRASPILQAAVCAKENIRIHYDTVVEEIRGEKAVEELALLDKAGKRERLAVSGVFIAIGTRPDNGLFASSLPLTEDGYFDAGEDCATPVPGVFVAGDSRKKPLRQIVTAAADGAVAATMAANYLNTLGARL